MKYKLQATVNKEFILNKIEEIEEISMVTKNLTHLKNCLMTYWKDIQKIVYLIC